MRHLFYTLSLFSSFFAALMLLPSIAAMIYGEILQARVFLVSSTCIGFISGSVLLALSGAYHPLKQSNKIRFIVLSWLFLPLLAAIPLLLMPQFLRPSHALFETLSALTTTGSTILPTLNDVPKSIIFWRALLQWVGGLGTLLSCVLILAPCQMGGLPKLGAGKLFGRHGSERFIRITLFYSAASFACFLMLLIVQTPLFDALCLTFSALSTGGMMPRDGTISDYNNYLLQWILVFFMLVGATSILWHSAILHKKRFLMYEYRESYIMILFIFILGFIFALISVSHSGNKEFYTILTALREGFFSAASLISTTGFEARSNSFASLPIAVIATLAFIGGATMSTAGGLKYYRVGIMALQAIRELNRTIYPNSVRGSYMGSLSYDIQTMKSVWTLFMCSFGCVALTTIILSLNDAPPVASMVAAIGALSNIGQIYTSGWLEAPHWPLYQDMSTSSLSALMVAMIIGRVEIVAFLGALGSIIFRNRFIA